MRNCNNIKENLKRCPVMSCNVLECLCLSVVLLKWRKFALLPEGAVFFLTLNRKGGARTLYGVSFLISIGNCEMRQ